MKRKDRTAEKRQPIPSGLAGTAPLRRAFGLGFRVVLVCFFVACACRGGAKRRRSRIKDKHTPRLQKQYKQLKVRLKTHENGAYIIFELADKLLKFKCAYAIIILSNNLDGV